MKLRSSLGLTALLVAVSLSVSAGTLYVDPIFGDDIGNTTCKKTTPCLDIQHAIDSGGAGSRIVLAPGLHEGTLNIVDDNIRITSIAGAMATEILGDDHTAAALINVSADKFTLGGKGKGVTVARSFGMAMDPTDQAGVRVMGDKAKVEGNIFNGDEFSAPYDITEQAIYISGSQSTIRFNEIRFWNRGIQVVSSGAPAKSIISDNYVDGIGGTCVHIDSANKSADKVTGNRVEFCNEDFDEPRDGIVLEYDESVISSKPKVQKNTVRFVRNGIYVANALPTITGNLVNGANKDSNDDDEDGSGIVLWATQKAKVTNNYTTGTVNTIFFSSFASDSVVTGNTMLGSFNGPWIENTSESPIKLFNKNNLDIFFCPVATEGTDYTAKPIEMKQNFWYFFGDPTDGNAPDFTFSTDCANATTAKGNGTLIFTNSADKPNPVKFKSPI